jgi:hypothetical protein
MKSVIYIKLRLELEHEKEIENVDTLYEEFLDELDYNFTSNTHGVTVQDTELVDYYVAQMNAKKADL